MSFGSKRSAPPNTDPKPTFNQVEAPDRSGPGSVSYQRRQERYETRSTPSANILEGNGENYETGVMSGGARRRRAGPAPRPAMMG